jgi:hypothetical protein
VRPFGDVNGSVGVPSVELVSKVTSWSMNWPMKVVPAVWVVLSGLLTLNAGFVISAIGPALSWSCASSGPPCAPSASSDLVTPFEAGANAGRLGKSRPKCCASVDTNRLRAGAARTTPATEPETPPPTATAPAPTPALTRNPRLLYRDRAPVCSLLIEGYPTWPTPPTSMSTYIPIARCGSQNKTQVPGVRLTLTVTAPGVSAMPVMSWSESSGLSSEKLWAVLLSVTVSQ